VVNVGLVFGMWGKGMEEGGGDSLETFGRWRTFTWSVEERNGERSMYFVCDFNGRWSRDLSFLCCIDVLLSVEGRIVLVIKSKMFLLTSIFTFLLGQRVRGLNPR
jgi:hypothetical protein